MNKSLSTYLDAVRFLSALTVMGAHMTFPQFIAGIAHYQGAWAGAGVTVFFVLSGYVIRHVSVNKEHTLREYALSRMARIYSVAIPAILLTIFLDGVGMILGSDKPLPMYQYTQLWKYMPIFLTFLTEVGPIRENMLTNGVFWSLSYEVSYYILFAAAVYLSGWRRRILVCVLLASFGPRILIYLPIWLFGVAIYEMHQRIIIARPLARILFAGSLCAVVAIRLTGIDDVGDAWMNDLLGGYSMANLRNSQHFIGHYMIACAMVVNLFAANYVELGYLGRPSVEKSIVYCASFTFALYLAHRPLMDFYSLVIHHDPHSPLSIIVLTVLVLASVWVFGLISEHKKNWWRRLFSRFIKTGSVQVGSL